MRRLIPIPLLLGMVAADLVNGQPLSRQDSSKFQTRCGWLTNPTPANIWFYDRDGEWTIGVQGGYQVEADWPWPEFAPKQWVSTNTGSYGYGCACFSMRVDKETRHVLEIKSSRGRPLSACRKDRALKKWEREL